MKIIVYDEYYWKKILNIDALVEFGMISPEDIDLLTFCNDVDTAFKEITTHLEENYFKQKKTKKKTAKKK